MNVSWDNLSNEFTLEDLDQLQIIDEIRSTKRVSVRLGLMFSFYLRDAQAAETRLSLARCADHYQVLAGEQLALYLDPYASKNSHPKPYPKKAISFTDYILECNDPNTDAFIAQLYGDGDIYAATRYGLDIFASRKDDEVLGKRPAYLHGVLPFSWLQGRDHQGAFQTLMHEWCKVLKPFHAYAGIGAIQSMNSIEKDRTIQLVYPLAKRFPGLEIDSPGDIASAMIRSGGPLKIKGGNWLTALDNECFEQLGGRDAVLEDLKEGFKYYDYEGGVLMQAGPVPQLGDANQNHTPYFYQQLARKLKPIRLRFTKGHYLLKSPNRQEKTNFEVSNEWLARFD